MMEDRMKKLLLKFSAYSAADILAFSALNFTLILQSSINVEGGLGTNSLAVTFSTAILFGLVTTPIILRSQGPKVGLILSLAMMTMYIAANYYPAYFTMMPAAVMLALSEATIWPSLVLMNFYFGKKYSKLKNKPEESQHYINLFSGCFFTAHHLNQVVGGIAGYFLLAVNDEDASRRNTTQANSTVHSNDSYAVCGANDCQMETEVDEIITKYTPTNRIKLTIMISVFVFMSISSLVLQVWLLPNPKRTVTSESSRDITSNAGVKELIDDNADFPEDNDISMKCIDKPVKDNKKRLGMISTVRFSITEIAKQLVRPKQVLLLPITFYHGLLTTFVISELPRAYISCVRGYTAISLYSCVFGVAHISACIMGRLSRRTGHTVILLWAAISDIANLTFCLLWQPDIYTSWMIYVSYFMFGMTDGIWQLSLNLSHVAYFPRTREEAGSVWVTVLNLGLAVQFAWSTALCQYVKLYAMLGTLVVGITMFCIAERIHKKELSQARSADS